MGTVWGANTWGANTWGANTWGDSEEPVVNEAKQSVMSMAVGIGMSIAVLFGIRI